MIDYLAGKATLASEGRKLRETYTQNKGRLHIVLGDIARSDCTSVARPELTWCGVAFAALTT